MTQALPSDSQAYKARVVDPLVETYLRAFGGLLIEGPKWCGKTWTGQHHANSAVYVEDQDTQDLADLDPVDVLTGPSPRLVDEWQDAPLLWDKARRMIDQAAQKGMFIFTGSAVPPREATKHSGVGRFARLRMRPMSLFESGESTGSVSLAGLMQGESVRPQPSRLTLKDVVWLISRGGWAGSLGLPRDEAIEVPQQYLVGVAESDLSRVDGVDRDPMKVAAVVRSLARHTATAARVSTIHADVVGQEDKKSAVSLSSVKNYLTALERIFVIDDLPAWRYSIRSKTQLRVSSKRHLADPSLAVAALGANPAVLHRDVKTTGFLFESLCVRDLRVYAQANRATVLHYRDANGLEVAAVMTGPGDNWGAVEVKLGRAGVDAAAVNLLRLRNKLHGVAPEPAFLLVLTATGGVVHTRDDGVHVVPIDCLGP